MSVSAATRYRLDDLRRLGAALASGLGVAPARASALATHLLWFDAAGASTFGIASLVDWLDRIDRKEVDPVAEGRPRLERSGTAVFDARGGLAPLALARAAGIAAEKARDVGVGIVRVENLGPSGPAAPAVADLAVGPFLGLIAGPGPSMALAIPTAEGLPALYDSALGPATEAAPGWSEAWGPWIAAVSGAGGWSILALAVPSMEPLTAFHERAAGSFGESEGGGACTLHPASWEASRREARERGVALDEGAVVGLRRWSERLGVAWPASQDG